VCVEGRPVHRLIAFPAGPGCVPTRAAQRKLLLEANRRPPSLVDVSRAVTAGQGGVAVTAGRRAPQCPAPQLLHTPQQLHPARALGVAVA
jgi:hypothetical protein